MFTPPGFPKLEDGDQPPAVAEVDDNHAVSETDKIVGADDVHIKDETNQRGAGKAAAAATGRTKGVNFDKIHPAEDQDFSSQNDSVYEPVKSKGTAASKTTVKNLA